MNLYTFLKIEMFLNIFFSFVETLESVTFTLCTSILLSNKKQPSKAKKSLVFIVNHIVMYLLSFVIYVPMGILLRTHFYEEHYFDSDLHNATGQFWTVIGLTFLGPLLSLMFSAMYYKVYIFST